MIWKITRRKHNVVFVFGKQAKVLREMLDSAVVPDRTALEKEADEFEQYMLKKREETLALRRFGRFFPFWRQGF